MFFCGVQPRRPRVVMVTEAVNAFNKSHGGATYMDVNDFNKSYPGDTLSNGVMPLYRSASIASSYFVAVLVCA